MFDKKNPGDLWSFKKNFGEIPTDDFYLTSICFQVPSRKAWEYIKWLHDLMEDIEEVDEDEI